MRGKNMKLKQKAVVVVSITMILLVTLFLSFLRPVLLKESNDLDRDTAIGEVKRIENNIQSTLHNLGKINRDWSIWDDTYDFMMDQNPLYIERNLEPETFANLNINYIIYIDSEKKPKLQVGYDLDNKKIVPLQNDFYEEFLPAIKSVENTSEELLVMSKNGFSLASFESIYQSNGDGPSVGTLIIGKYLDERTINRIGKELSFDLTFHEVQDNEKTQGRIGIEITGADQMQGSILLKDYKEQSLLGISFNMDRSFYMEKKNTVNNIAVSLVIIGIIFVLLTIFLLDRFIISRISNLSKQLHNIQAEGNVNLRIHVKKNQHDEISKLENSINQVLSSLEEKHDEVIQLALYDHLTGLPNRYAFKKEVSRRMDASTNELIILFVDLDGFKQVNDTYGHEIGDQLLRELSQRVQIIAAEKNGLVARYGGDEFLVLFDQMNDQELERIVQRLLEEIGREYQFNAISTLVTASIGISIYPRDGTTIEQVLKSADTAMYEAKNKGKNQYVCFHEINNND